MKTCKDRAIVCSPSDNMAKKQEETRSLLETFTDFNETQNIDSTTLLGVLEESFRSGIAKLFGSKSRATARLWPTMPSKTPTDKSV